MLDATMAPIPQKCEVCGKPAEYWFTLDDKPQYEDQHWVCSKKCGIEVFSRYFDENSDKIKEHRATKGDFYVHTDMPETMDFIRGQLEKDGHKCIEIKSDDDE